MSLINISDENSLNGYPINGLPASGNFLLFNGSEWTYTSYSPGGLGLTSMVNVGTGVQILKNIISNIGYLRSIVSSGNIVSTQLTDEINISLNTTLTGINEISFGNFKIKNNDPFFDFLISDGGLSQPRSLRIQTQFGLTISTPIEINNSNQIFLNNVSTGTQQYTLGLDNTGKIIKYVDTSGGTITAGQNLYAGSFGFKEIFKQVVGTTMQFRTITVNSGNLTIQTFGDATHAIGMNEFINLQGINTSNPLDVLTLGGVLYLQDLMAQPAGGNYSLFIDPSNMVYKSYALSSYSFLGLGAQIINSQNNSDLIFKTLIGGDNITALETANTITFNLDSGLQNITSINSASDNLNLNGNIFLPNAPTGTYDKALFLDSSGKIIKGDTINTIITSGTGTSIINTQIGDLLILKSFEGGNNIDMVVTASKISFTMTSDIYNVDSINRSIFSLNTPTLNLSASVFNVPNIPTGTESYYLALDSSNKVIKVNASVGNQNIYNSNGQLTTGDRVIQGFNIGGYNRIIYDNVNFSFQNNVRYAPDNLLILNSDEIMYTADYGGIDSRAMWAPYNYTSQKFQISGLGTYKNFYYFYENILPLSGVDSSYNLEVDIYELTSTNNGFVGNYKILANYSTLSFGVVYSVKNTRSSLIPSSGTFNQLDLLIYTATGGKLNIGVCQVSTTPSAGVYQIFVKDYSASGYKKANLINSTGTLTNLIQNQYFASLTDGMSTLNGNGTPPSMIFSFNLYRDIIISCVFDYLTNAAITAFNFSVKLNGSPVLTKLVTAANNTHNTLVARRRLNVNQLLNSGVLLFGTNTITFTFSPNMTFVNKSYEFNIEFI